MEFANDARSTSLTSPLGTASEVDGHAGRGQPTLHPGGEVADHGRLGQAVRRLARVAAAVPWVDHDHLAGQRRAGGSDLLGLAEVAGAAAHHRPGQPVERLERPWPAGAVGAQADVVLEVADRTCRVLAEHPVRAT